LETSINIKLEEIILLSKGKDPSQYMLKDDVPNNDVLIIDKMRPFHSGQNSLPRRPIALKRGGVSLERIVSDQPHTRDTRFIPFPHQTVARLYPVPGIIPIGPDATLHHVAPPSAPPLLPFDRHPHSLDYLRSGFRPPVDIKMEEGLDLRLNH